MRGASSFGSAANGREDDGPNGVGSLTIRSVLKTTTTWPSALNRAFGFFIKNMLKLFPQNEPTLPTRTLKIEATGDFWKGLSKPKIRLMGHWLERAGFSPGNHVHVICIAPGVMELRSQDVS